MKIKEILFGKEKTKEEQVEYFLETLNDSYGGLRYLVNNNDTMGAVKSLKDINKLNSKIDSNPSLFDNKQLTTILETRIRNKDIIEPLEKFL